MSGKLEDWIGRKESHDDVATAWPVAALHATLDRSVPVPPAGEAIPPGWHWLYFLDTTCESDIGRDGLPKLGDFLPPVTLPRRMWAGGRIEFPGVLHVGDALRRDSEIVAVDQKEGRRGKLVFVTVRHTVYADGKLAVVEDHDIVYRDAAQPGEAPPRARPAPASAKWQRSLVADPVMLFRFSALIFNANRIHYDLAYVKEEGYAGLVVHGPLQTVLMLDLCREHGAKVAKIEYRAEHPVYHTERMSVCANAAQDGSKIELWTANEAGSYAMTGTATLT